MLMVWSKVEFELNLPNMVLRWIGAHSSMELKLHLFRTSYSFQNFNLILGNCNKYDIYDCRENSINFFVIWIY